MDDIRFLVFDPGHFHAALVFKEMYRGASDTVHIYAPLGPDLRAWLQHIEGFNTRRNKPTSWNLEVHTGRHPLYRMSQDKAGNVVILAGRNRDKIATILECLSAGFHVLADKPWIVSLSDLENVQRAVDLAERKGLIALDIMTERHEITSILQREFIRDPEVFGEIDPGDPGNPGVVMESVHSIKKQVAGIPLRRSAAFFDFEQQGEGLTDVGTHLVDLVLWMLLPGQAIDVHSDLNLNGSQRWTTPVLLADFQDITGLETFPDFLRPHVRGTVLPYCCNNLVTFCIRGIFVKLAVSWSVRTPRGIDSHFAAFRGSRCKVEVRQSRERNSRPNLFIRPRQEEDLPKLRQAVERRCKILENDYRNLEVREETGELQIVIPDRYYKGHEAHFGAVTRQFLDYVLGRQRLPGWEKTNMLAKYRLTTAGVHLARGGI